MSAAAHTPQQRRRAFALRRPHAMVETLTPPEGVPLHFHLAPIAARAAALSIDIALTFVIATTVIIVLLLPLGAPFTLVVAVSAIASLAIRAPYYLATELLWQGRTLGKKMTGLRVVSADGRSLTARALVIRNLMKEAEVLVPVTLLLGASDVGTGLAVLMLVWMAAAAAVPILSKRRQRFGDFAANTIVIAEPAAVLLPDLAAASQDRAKEAYVFLPHNLDHYGAYELQTLEALLHATYREGSEAANERRQATIVAVSETIRQKIDYSGPIVAGEETAFLRAFYNAQRAHLEHRQLMGERREDKHYRADEDEVP